MSNKKFNCYVVSDEFDANNKAPYDDTFISRKNEITKFPNIFPNKCEDINLDEKIKNYKKELKKGKNNKNNFKQNEDNNIFNNEIKSDDIILTSQPLNNNIIIANNSNNVKNDNKNEKINNKEIINNTNQKFEKNNINKKEAEINKLKEDKKETIIETKIENRAEDKKDTLPKEGNLKENKNLNTGNLINFKNDFIEKNTDESISKKTDNKVDNKNTELENNENKNQDTDLYRSLDKNSVDIKEDTKVEQTVSFSLESQFNDSDKDNEEKSNKQNAIEKEKTANVNESVINDKNKSDNLKNDVVDKAVEQKLEDKSENQKLAGNDLKNHNKSSNLASENKENLNQKTLKQENNSQEIIKENELENKLDNKSQIKNDKGNENLKLNNQASVNNLKNIVNSNSQQKSNKTQKGNLSQNKKQLVSDKKQNKANVKNNGFAKNKFIFKSEEYFQEENYLKPTQKEIDDIYSGAYLFKQNESSKTNDDRQYKNTDKLSAFDKIEELEKTSGQDKNEVKTENQIEEKTDKQKELEEVKSLKDEIVTPVSVLKESPQRQEFKEFEKEPDKKHEPEKIKQKNIALQQDSKLTQNKENKKDSAKDVKLLKGTKLSNEAKQKVDSNKGFKQKNNVINQDKNFKNDKNQNNVKFEKETKKKPEIKKETENNNLAKGIIDSAPAKPSIFSDSPQTQSKTVDKTKQKQIEQPEEKTENSEKSKNINILKTKEFLELQKNNKKKFRFLSIVLILMVAVNVVLATIVAYNLKYGGQQNINVHNNNIVVQGDGITTQAVTSAWQSSVCVAVGGNITDENTFFSKSANRGSGIIYKIDENSKTTYIVTCYHVVQGYANSIFVMFANYLKPIKVEIVGYSEKYDIAVLKAQNMDSVIVQTVAKIYDSQMLSLGESVFTIGNSLSSGLRVSSGIISMLNKKVNVESGIEREIQTDATINPGNSGGGLFNTSGEFIGLVNAKLSSIDSGDGSIIVEGTSYAIPGTFVINVASSIIRNNGQATFASIGAEFTHLDRYVSMTNVNGKNIQTYEVSVSSVEKSSPAYGKLQANDIIQSFEYEDINGEKHTITMYNEYCYEDIACNVKIGSDITFKIIRPLFNESKTVVIKASNFEPIQ